jgi:SAM-dependent methyltransferase
MKVRNPKNRFDLAVSRSERVLEVGGGHNPHPRANVEVDKFTDTNYHRSGDIKVLGHQEFINVDGETLPFKDKEFDYVICCHVLEHVENPHIFLQEQFRVAKRGYIEIPSLLGEVLAFRESHKWVLHEHNDVLYIVDKQKINFQAPQYNLMELVQDYLPKHSIGFKIVERTHANLMTIRIEWKDDFKYVVDPTDPEILKYFSGTWKEDWGNEFFPKRTMGQEFKAAAGAFMDITKSVFRSKVIKK